MLNVGRWIQYQVTVLPNLFVLLCLVSVPTALAQTHPTYRIKASLNNQQHLLEGVVEIQLAQDDPRAKEGLWLHLPPNRFLEEDPRGARREIQMQSIGMDFTELDTNDNAFGNGFDQGHIQIISATDQNGQTLQVLLGNNPKISLGYSIDQGLARIVFPNDKPIHKVELAFRVKLPERYWDGWHDSGVTAIRWHPILARYDNGSWQEDPLDEEIARFEVELTTDTLGWALNDGGPPRKISAGIGHTLSNPTVLRRFFPLVLRWDGAVSQQQNQGRVYSILSDGEEDFRTNQLALAASTSFADYMAQQYGLALPFPNINIVKSAQGTGEPWSAGNTIFIPTVYFKNDPLLDRIFVAKIAATMAEMWFGETVLANLNHQAWLPLGLPVYFGLEFFEHTYGSDASIHSLVDWLAPKYREHYFEMLSLQLARAEKAQPLTIPMLGEPSALIAKITHLHKGPLFFRTLRYLIGQKAFQEGLIELFQTYKFRSVVAEDMRLAFEKAYGKSLESYFDQFFYGNVDLDYALEGWEESTVNGVYQVTVSVQRLAPGILPVEVQLVHTDGTKTTQRISGDPEHQKVVFSDVKPVKTVSLDPGEFLVETDRQNNYTQRAVRLRPFFDWSKAKETLITVEARLGGNAIDGNYIGAGATFRFDDDHQFSAIPIDGQNHDDLLYEVSFKKRHLWGTQMTYELGWLRLGGAETLSNTLRVRTVSTDRLSILTDFSINMEEVEGSKATAENPDDFQQPGKTNNFNIFNIDYFSLAHPNDSMFFFELEHSQPTFGSNFRYSSILAGVNHDLFITPNNKIRLELIRGGASGAPPIQKRHLLGDPLVLRGFPRTTDLVYDNLAAFRAEYHLVLTRGIIGGVFQTRKTSLILFSDVGRGWNNGEKYNSTRIRRDAGFGLNIDIDALSMLQFPLRVEIGYPINDPEYKNEQFIFFQALSFF